MKHLKKHPLVASRKYFYGVEKTATQVLDNPVLHVKPVAERIHAYVRLFIARRFSEGCDDRLQIFLTGS
ncbi:hypothetical protein K1719_025719 [Acacia pycnantha]|nr:hypothetical protein K1719_025719 [Acacia pycnantha]